MIRFRFWMLVFLLTAVGFLPRNRLQELKAYHLHGYAQGTTYAITYYATDSLLPKGAVEALFRRIDSSLSLYKPYSLINRFNASSGGVLMDDHLRAVVLRSLEIHQATGGIFDLTIHPLVAAWGFGTKPTAQMPSEAEVQKLRACVGSRFLKVRGPRLVKKKACLALDANGIAQGYTVDVLAGLLEDKGIGDYLVELGGEIRWRGRKQPGGAWMRIGIEAPAADGSLTRIIQQERGAVTTSGNYRRFRESAGGRISHLLDARTGYPVRNELISVTVLAADAVTADGYDNALMAMGLTAAFSFLQTHRELEAYFIYRQADGSVRDTATKNFPFAPEEGLLRAASKVDDSF